ncbi:MAG: hypothetical protein ACHQ0J_12895 [Candidatus Dormibacterales bacterium]
MKFAGGLAVALLLAACGSPQAAGSTATPGTTAATTPSSVASPTRTAAPQPSQPSTTPSVPAYFACEDARTCPPLADIAMAFDPVRDEIVTFGGSYHSGPVTDETWRFRDGRWAQLHPAHVPPPRIDTVLVFDAAHGVVVMYGGSGVPASAAAGTGGDVGGITFAADTWTWDGSDWTEQHPAHRPVPFIPDGTYDYARNQIVLLGFDRQMETWTYDGTDWTHRTNADGKPDPPRRQVWLSFDSASQTVVTFGGHNDGGADVSAVWEWDGQTWGETAAKSPPVQYFGPMAPELDRAGMLIYNPLLILPTSTWRWNGTTFEQLQPGHAPALAVEWLQPDPPRHRLLLFGYSPERQFQVWSWSGQDWTQITV